MKKFSILSAVLFITIFSISAYSQWQTLTQSVVGAGTYPSISVVSADVFWIAGGTNTPSIWRSTDGGTSITNATGTGISLDVFCVCGRSSTECYVGDGGAAGGVGGNAKVYKTTDGGATWTVVLQTGGTAGFINGIAFSKSNPQIGVLESDPPLGAGQPYFVYLTTNGGTNWNSVTCPGVTGAASAQNSVMVIDAQFFGFGLNAAPSRVRFTSDGGSSWITASLGIAGAFVSGFAFNDDKMTGISATGDQTGSSLPNIARTTNGSTFSIVNTGAGLTGYGNCKFINGTNVCYVSGSTGSPDIVRRSTDGGATWTNMTTGGNANITHMDFYKDVNNVIWGYAVCNDGTVMKLQDNILVGVSNNQNNIPGNYTLEQNYPNPFNPATTIKYSLPKSSYVTLKIYDALGNEVMTAVNGYKTAGSYTTSIDASNLSSGVYFYRLEAGSFTDTKKMTLLK